jgi:hypothetical protein
MWWQILIASVLLSGCSLPSIDFVPGGNAAANKIGADMYRIGLRQRGPNCGSADECTLLAAAEAGKSLGGTHFMVIPGHGSPSQKGFAYIKVFTLEPGEVPPSGAVSIEEILYFLDRRPSKPDQTNPIYASRSSDWATQVASSVTTPPPHGD